MINHYKILVVDDDPGIRDTYREILLEKKPDLLVEKGVELFDGTPSATHQQDRLSFNVILEERGDKSIEIVKTGQEDNQPVSLIFLDMSIPGMNGAEAAREIWKIDPSIKIVFVTAFNEYTSASISKIAGRDDIFYLRKPFNPDEIRQFARALTTQWRLEKEKHTLTQKLQRANRELEELNASLNDRVEKQTAMLIQSEKMASLGILTSGIANKLNQPISKIKKNLIIIGEETVKVLENGDDSSSCRTTVKGLVEASQQQIAEVEKTVKNLKSISKSDDTTYKRTDIHSIIDSTLDIIYNDIQTKISIKKNYSKLPNLRCFPGKLSQALLNILVNAVQAAEKKGEIEITTTLEQLGKRDDDRHVQVVIQDNGGGIAQEDLNNLFDPFYTTKPIGEGTGLGLSITYDIIKLHQGDISIDSKLGEGTTVTITLPIN